MLLLSNLIHGYLRKALKGSTKSHEKTLSYQWIPAPAPCPGLAQINLMIPQLALAAEAEDESYSKLNLWFLGMYEAGGVY